MNQLNIFIIFVPLCSCFLRAVECVEDRNVFHFNRALNYSFEGFSCVQMFSLEETPWEYYKFLHEIGVPVVINQTQKYCYGFILFASDTIHIRKMLFGIKKYYNHRIVCYLQYQDLKLEAFVKNNSHLFGESEALVSDGCQTYKLDPVEKRFYEMNLTGEEDNWGKQKEIMNFKGREITIASFNVSMFTEWGPVDKNGKPAWVKGSDLYIFWMLKSLMNVTWKVIIIKEKWGLKLSNGSWTKGIFKAVSNGEADIGMGSVWLSIEIYDSLALSAAINKLSITYLVRRPTAINALWSSYFRHYSLSLWGYLLVAAFVNILAVFLITYWTINIHDDVTDKIWSSISACSLMTYGVITVNATLPSRNNQGPLRFLLSSWAIITFVFMTDFGSSLISHLTNPDLKRRPETIKELVQGGYYWGLTYIPDFEQFLDFNDTWHRKWAKRFVLIRNKEEHMRLLDNEKFILWGKAMERKYFVMVEDYWTSDLLSGWEIARDKLATFYTTFVLTPGSQFIPAVTKYSTRVIEAGYLHKHRVSLLQHEGDPYMHEVLVKTKQGTIGPVSLTISNLMGVFYIIFVGLSVATILFFIELMYYKNTRD